MRINEQAYSYQLSDGTTYIKHAEYQESLVGKTDSQLRFICKDAQRAIDANPNGHKAGYYEDEILYCRCELGERKLLRIQAQALDHIKDIINRNS